MPAWKEYQETAAGVFRELGFDAATDVSVTGARPGHDVDVVAIYHHAGLQLTWLIECKRWARPVSKNHVLALRTIVEDTGADRGILLAENGFQSGAYEATRNSNVMATSLEELQRNAANWLTRQRLLRIPERVAAAHARYWSIPKSERERTGLRPDGPSIGYSGGSILTALPPFIIQALAGQLPPKIMGLSLPVRTQKQAADVAERLLDDLEKRLDGAEATLSPEMKATIAVKREHLGGGSVQDEADERAVEIGVRSILDQPFDDVVRGA